VRRILTYYTKLRTESEKCYNTKTCQEQMNVVCVCRHLNTVSIISYQEYHINQIKNMILRWKSKLERHTLTYYTKMFYNIGPWEVSDKRSLKAKSFPKVLFYSRNLK
jgi:hypothetical protein